MEKIYRVQMNSSGMPNFSTAVEIDTEISDYSDKLWRIAYERGKADRPQGEWMHDDSSPIAYRCTACNTLQHWSVIQNGRYRYCPNCGARMKGADDE